MQISFPLEEFETVEKASKMARQHSRSGSFTDNMRLPVHRWFRYSAGFSAEWAAIEIAKTAPGAVILDPFAGSGTTLLAADGEGRESVGLESHHFVARIAQAKLLWHLDPKQLKALGDQVLARAKVLRAEKGHDSENVPPLLVSCFSADSLADLDALRNSYLEIEVIAPCGPLIWLAITSILRVCSPVGTAQWQYVLPKKSKAKSVAPFDAFEAAIHTMAADMREVQELGYQQRATILLADARSAIPPAPVVDLVVTSPPYPNNYDYADATRLEMTFWREISSWGDLHGSVRQHIIRSCSQHSAAEKLELDVLLASSSIDPIRSELSAVCNELAAVRLTKGGKKTYHTMVAAYFADLANVMLSLRSACKPGSEACFVIGDSAPYGVYVPVDKWLGTLAVHAGFHDPSFEKLRDRNTKWKNRKHTVPLQEGHLRFRG